MAAHQQRKYSDNLLGHSRRRRTGGVTAQHYVNHIFDVRLIDLGVGVQFIDLAFVVQLIDHDFAIRFIRLVFVNRLIRGHHIIRSAIHGWWSFLQFYAIID